MTKTAPRKTGAPDRDHVSDPAAKPDRKYGRNTDGRFASGNSGKPRGARHKTTLAVERLMEGEGEQVARMAIDLAKAGDLTAIKLVLDRIAPVRRSATVNLSLPPVKTAADVDAAVAAVIAAVSSGEIDLDQGEALCAILEVRRKSVETVEVVEVLERLKRERNGGEG